MVSEYAAFDEGGLYEYLRKKLKIKNYVKQYFFYDLGTQCDLYMIIMLL